MPDHVSQHTSADSADLHSVETTPSSRVRTSAVRIVIADDNPVVRAGLKALMESRRDIQVVAEAADGRQACEAARQTRPDAVLLDVRMPGVDGISALPHLARLAPVMMLTYSRESALVHESLRLGARGYLVHGEFTADQLVTSVRDLTDGGTPFSTTPAAALADRLRDHLAPHHPRVPGSRSLRRVSNPSQERQTPGPPPTDMKQSAVEQRRWATTVGRRARRTTPAAPTAAPTAACALSEREGEIMDLIASGMNNAQIAATCFISEKTVKNHINRIFTKLRVTTRSQAIAHWLGTSRPSGGTAGPTGGGNR